MFSTDVSFRPFFIISVFRYSHGQPAQPAHTDDGVVDGKHYNLCCESLRGNSKPNPCIKCYFKLTMIHQHCYISQFGAIRSSYLISAYYIQILGFMEHNTYPKFSNLVISVPQTSMFGFQMYATCYICGIISLQC